MQARRIRRLILDHAYRAGVGHIGSALSIADIVATLYGGVLRVDDPTDPERDRFVLSKGHAALALYAALHLKGWVTAEQLATYCGDGTMLGVSSRGRTPRGRLRHRVPSATGSRWAPARPWRLGCRAHHDGPASSSATPSATKARSGKPRCSPRTTSSRTSPRSSTSTVSRRSATRATCSDLSPLAERWRAFGWDVDEVDARGDDAQEQLLPALNEPDDTDSSKPRAG